MENNSILKVNDLEVRFKKNLREDFKALDNVCIELKKGDFFGLLGPNGAGKTTFVRSILGLQKINKGEISLFGTEPFPGSDVFKRVAYIPENPIFPEYLTINETIRFFLSDYGIKPDSKDLKDVLEKLDLIEFSETAIKKCSKGMKQKVNIAYCMLFKPELLVFDELTRGLDPMTVRNVRNILIEMNQMGTTLIMNSHILSEVEMVCSRIGILNHGKLITQGSLDELLVNDDDYYMIEFQKTDYVPKSLKDIVIKDNHLIGYINKEQLTELLEDLFSHSIKVFDISLKHESLENLMIRLIESDKSDGDKNG